MADTPLTIGIDIGGTNVRLGVFDGVSCIKQTRFEANFSNICANNAPTQAWQQILQLLTNAINALIAEYPIVKNVGIGFPGFIDPQTNVIESSPNLPGLKNINLAADLSASLNAAGLKQSVTVANDANVAALGEYYLAGQPAGGLLYCGLGTGVGGGLVLNGQPYAGNHGCAMEIGHIIVHPQGRQCGCGNLGCLETYASATGVAKTFLELTGHHQTAHTIAEHAKTGDADAIQAYQVAAEALAYALASVVKVVDVKTIVIGGGMAGAWPVMQASFDQRFKADLMPVLRDKVNVQLASGSDLAGMTGAACLRA